MGIQVWIFKETHFFGPTPFFRQAKGKVSV
jgi:hypothetical protein